MLKGDIISQAPLDVTICEPVRGNVILKWVPGHKSKVLVFTLLEPLLKDLFRGPEPLLGKEVYQIFEIGIHHSIYIIG